MNKINYQAWALYENFDIFTAAALWCDKNPYDCQEWGDWEYVEVRNLVIHLFKYQLDDEKYPEDKRNIVIVELGKRLDGGLSECLAQCKKMIITRGQLKEIAFKIGVRPKFLFGDINEQEEAISMTLDVSDSCSDLLRLNRDIDKWLFEVWLENDQPGGSVFFTKLKKYKNVQGSPILDHYSSGAKPGLKWRTVNLEGELSRKRIQNMVSDWTKKMHVKP